MQINYNKFGQKLVQKIGQKIVIKRGQKLCKNLTKIGQKNLGKKFGQKNRAKNLGKKLCKNLTKNWAKNLGKKI